MTGGLLMAIGLVGALFIIGGSGPDSPGVDASPLFQLVFLAMGSGLALIAAVLPAMYVRQARPTGGLGLLGFVLTAFGVLLDLGLAVLVVITVPWLATAAPKLLFAGPGALFILLYGAFLLLGIGSLVLGLATTQAGVLPRGAGFVLMVSGLINVLAVPSWPISVAGFIGQFLFAGGLAWVGYALVAGREVETVRPLLATSEIQRTEAGS